MLRIRIDVDCVRTATDSGRRLTMRTASAVETRFIGRAHFTSAIAGRRLVGLATVAEFDVMPRRHVDIFAAVGKIDITIADLAIDELSSARTIEC